MPGRKHTFFALSAEKRILPRGIEDPTRYFASDLLFKYTNRQESGELRSCNHGFFGCSGEADPGFGRIPREILKLPLTGLSETIAS